MTGKKIKRHRSAYLSDIIRTIQQGKRRFFSLMLITVLGVTMFSGLLASCMDLRYSADHFFDEQHLHDIKILSTLGLTEDDLRSIEGIEDVESAEMEWSLEEKTKIGDSDVLLEYRSATIDGMDVPYVVEGRLPKDSSEAAITKKTAADYNLAIGDTLIVSADEEVELSDNEAGDEETENDKSTDHAADEERASWEPYLKLTQKEFTVTAIVTDAADINNPFGSVSYRTDASKANTVFVLPEVFDGNYCTAIRISVAGAVSDLCYTEIYKNRIDNVKDEIANTVQKEREIARNEEVIGGAQTELDDAREEADQELRDAFDELTEAEEELDEAESELEKSQKEYDDAIALAAAQLPEGQDMAQVLPQEYVVMKEQLDAAKEEIDDARKEIDEGWEDYRTNENKAEQEFSDAQDEIDEMKSAEWYLQDRGSLSGYASIESDADSIEAIGTVFPVVFFIVAILISLTTITRMVEEDRSLIGTYKSLGFTDREIRKKYLIYAGAAAICGSVIGTIFAFIGLPAFIFTVFDVMYLLPSYSWHFVPLYGIAGPAIFIIGILLASGLAVKNEVKMVPASLMRPLAPRAGSRILLEKIKSLWSRLSFLQKVTARNLFRYKKRLFMTIFGIAGCTSLMLFGFSIGDSVADLSPRQYEQTFLFDVMSVADSDNTEPMITFINEENSVKDAILLHMTSAELKNTEGKSTVVTVMVIPSEEDLSSYIHLENKDSGELLLQDGTIYVTRNAANVLGLTAGDPAILKLADLQNAQIDISALSENYLGNYLYMTDKTYEKYFDKYEINAVLAHLSGAKEEQIALTNRLEEVDGVLSVTGIAELESQFSDAFLLIYMVVAIVILMSAALAFVVLFTLASTNISERARELATMKVLGFFDPEVHTYINRETVILTGIGILLGMPLGRIFAESLTIILNLPSIYLAVSLKPLSYLYALILNIVFTAIVNFAIGKTMDQIDPVEALKSVE